MTGRVGPPDVQNTTLPGDFDPALTPGFRTKNTVEDRVGSDGAKVTSTQPIVRAVALNEPKKPVTKDVHGFRVSYSLPRQQGTSFSLPVTLTRPGEQFEPVTFKLDVSVGQDMVEYDESEFRRAVEHAISILALAQGGYAQANGGAMADSFTLTADGRAELNGSKGSMVLNGDSTDRNALGFAREHGVLPSRLALVHLHAEAIRSPDGTISDAVRVSAQKRTLSTLIERRFDEGSGPLKPYEVLQGESKEVSLVHFWAPHIARVLAFSFGAFSPKAAQASKLWEGINDAKTPGEKAAALKKLVDLFKAERAAGLQELDTLHLDGKIEDGSPSARVINAIHGGADRSTNGGNSDEPVRALTGLDVKFSDTEDDAVLKRIAGLRSRFQHDIRLALQVLGLSERQAWWIADQMAPHKHSVPQQGTGATT